jgi:DNA polymerase elongation subunit (family B)
MSTFYTRVDPLGDNLLVRGFEDGKPFMKKVAYEPYMFLPTRDDTKYKTIDGKPVRKVPFNSMKECRDKQRQHKEVAGWEEFVGFDKFHFMYIYDTYKGEINYDPSLVSVVSLDIEVDIANDSGFPKPELAENEITLITISRKGKKSVFGCQPFDNKDPENVTYYKCVDEPALLRSFLDVWNSVEYSPHVVTGWNIDFFDIPYIINRIARVLGESAVKKLSPWGVVKSRTIDKGKDKSQTVWDMYGITHLDYIQLYKKFAYTPQESYSLDHVAFEELGEKKTDYSDLGTLADLQVKDWQRYTEYNIRDVELVDKLDDKLKLIELVMAMAYDAKVNYHDTFTTVGIWDVIIHNYLLDRCYVVPTIKVGDARDTILGGYVKDPQVGGHKWVVSLDLNSLYPHIIMQYNISPDTYVDVFPDAPIHLSEGADKAEPLVLMMQKGYLNAERHKYLIDNDLTCTANMRTFTRSKQGFLPALMEKMYNDRVVYKNQMIEAKKQLEQEKSVQLEKDVARFNNLQMAKKIQLNSGYGALANIYNRWYRADFAEAITSCGQLTTRWIEGKLNELLNKTFKTEGVDYVIACDTDSVYIKADRFIELAGKEMTTEQCVAYLDKVSLQLLEPFIDKKYEELCRYVNGYDQKMKMKRECIAQNAIWTAKKRYILNVWNQEGVAYSEPKLKMAGIEAIRTSTPMICRKAIKDTLGVIMNSTEERTQKFIADFRAEYNSMPFEVIASPRSVSDLNKYEDSSSIFAKGTPINVKGALMYNHLLVKHKLENKYEAIGDGQKIKYSYLKSPNPIQCNVIASPGTLPPEFGLDKYIDRDLQFVKSYLEPIKTIVEAIGWSVEKKFTLEDFWN